MYIQVDNAKTFIATGGKPFDASLPSVVLLHGSGTDHRGWALATDGILHDPLSHRP
jgi:predicted esterase